MKTWGFYLAVAAMWLFMPLFANAQRYEPRTTWPFIYEEFAEGNIRFLDGKVLTYDKLNISVINGHVMYVDSSKDQIMQADMMKVSLVKIGEDTYLNVQGRLYKVLNQTENGVVLAKSEINEYKLGKTEIGYGVSSATASSQGASAFALESSFSNSVISMGYNSLSTGESKLSGEVLPVDEILYLWVGNYLVKATKKDVSDLSAVDKSEFNSFLKGNKVKWNDPQSLVPVIDFLAEKLN